MTSSSLLKISKAASCKLQAAGYKPQAAGHMLQAAGHRHQATGYKLLQAAGYRPQAAGHKQQGGYKLQATSHRLQVTGYKLQAASYKQDHFEIYFCFFLFLWIPNIQVPRFPEIWLGPGLGRTNGPITESIWQCPTNGTIKVR